MKPYYQDQWTQIFLGDCREILPSLPKVDLVLTDPPYGIGFAAQPTNYQRYHGQKAESWDNKPPEPSLLDSIRINSRNSIIWGGNYFGLPAARCWLSWYKPDAPPSMGNVEYAWTDYDKNSRLFIQSIAATNGERLRHPTQKPLALITWCLAFAEEAELILDPYCGTGTSLRAAKNLERKSIGIELEERYCEIAAKRLAQEVLPFTSPPPQPRQVEFV